MRRGVDVANLSRNPTTKRSRPTFQLTNCVDIQVRLFVTIMDKGRPVRKEILPSPTIEGNVQPLKYQELLLMSEAERTREWIKVYTTYPLSTFKEPYEDNNPDVYVEWEGETYRVMKERHYKMGVLDHWNFHCAREPISAGGL